MLLSRSVAAVVYGEDCTAADVAHGSTSGAAADAAREEERVVRHGRDAAEGMHAVGPPRYGRDATEGMHAVGGEAAAGAVLVVWHVRTGDVVNAAIRPQVIAPLITPLIAPLIPSLITPLIPS